MIRIALLGCDSTHTEAFASLINNPDSAFQGRARVESIWGEDASQAVRKAGLLGIPRCAQTMNEALKDVDFAMVIGRFADSHFAPAQAALRLGIPTFVDKPFTATLEQARALAELAGSQKTKLLSSSPLRFAKELETFSGGPLQSMCVSVAAPANCVDLGDDKRFQSVFFYGIHAMEVLLELMGHHVRGVTVVPGKRLITIQVEFSHGTGSVQLVRDVEEFYEVRILAGPERRQFTISLDGSYYSRLLSFLLEQFYPGGGTIPLESTLQAIALLEKAEQTDRGVSDDA